MQGPQGGRFINKGDGRPVELEKSAPRGGQAHRWRRLTHAKGPRAGQLDMGQAPYPKTREQVICNSLVYLHKTLDFFNVKCFLIYFAYIFLSIGINTYGHCDVFVIVF